MRIKARVLCSLGSALLTCVLSLYFIERVGKYVLLPGYLALGAHYVVGGPALLIAIPLDWMFYSLLAFTALSVFNRQESKYGGE